MIGTSLVPEAGSGVGGSSGGVEGRRPGRATTGIFADGFESGDTSLWSAKVP